MSRRVPRGDVGPRRDGEPDNGPLRDQGAREWESTRGYAEQSRYDGQRQQYNGGQGQQYNGQPTQPSQSPQYGRPTQPGQQRYNGQQRYDGQQQYNGGQGPYDGQRQQDNGQGGRYDGQTRQSQRHDGQTHQAQRYDGQGQRYDQQRDWYDEQRERYDGQRERYEVPRPGPGDPAYGQPPRRKARFRRTRRFFRLRSVRVVSAVLALCLVWLMFSVGQAAFKNNGQSMSANLAEWARDHYLGPVVTFGEWLSYNPPPKGGKPSFSLAVPSGEAVTPAKTGGKSTAFVPDIPAALKPLVTSPGPGEGQWRVVEKVKGYPAILTTFLSDATYTSQVSGIASIDQRLVKFSLRPGTEDPGSSPWGYSDTYLPSGKRTGLLATFNGGFKLDSAGGGFYLDGSYHGSLVTGAASIVYYKDGTMKIGQWGRDFTMNSTMAGVRQNLKLIVDHGKISPNLNQDIETKFGATLGGGYYVWRSGLGITKDGRIIYVYGPSLNVQDLAELLHEAGAVEGMQMDINPAWMKFDYYQAGSHPSDPAPVAMLPTQQPSPYSYYTASTRDFTAVFAR